MLSVVFFFSSRRRHTRCLSDWSSDVCSSDLHRQPGAVQLHLPVPGESVELDGTRLTVTELDGRRVSRVKVSDTGTPGKSKGRSEERRVGKEWRARGSACQ